MKLILTKMHESVQDLASNATTPNRFHFEIDMDIEDMYEEMHAQSKPWCIIAKKINAKYNTTFNNKQIEKHYTTPFRKKKKFTSVQGLYIMSVRLLYPHAELRQIASEMGCYKKIIRTIFNKDLLSSLEMQKLTIAKETLSKIINKLPNNKFGFVNLNTFKKVQKEVESLIQNTKILPTEITMQDEVTDTFKYAFLK